MTREKLLGMVAAAELQLDALEFNPREFLAKLKKAADDNSLFEFPAMNYVLPYSGFDFTKAIPSTC